MYKNKVVVVVVFAIISFFVLRNCVEVGPSTIGTVSSYLLYPLLRIQQIFVGPVVSWLGRSVTIRELEKAVEQLQQEYDTIAAENIALKAMCSYADDIKELRDFNKRYVLQQGHIAQVLARHLSPSSQFFLVDAGSSQGIKKDMVALYRNAIVGRVVEVYPWYCKVCLITDADCKVASFCLPSYVSTNKNFKKGVSGIHEGINEATGTVVRYVSHLETVKEGYDVFSSGDGLVFPKGFALGKVISAEKGNLVYAITVKPIVDFHMLRYCTLIAKESI